MKSNHNKKQTTAFYKTSLIFYVANTVKTVYTWQHFMMHHTVITIYIKILFKMSLPHPVGPILVLSMCRYIGLYFLFRGLTPAKVVFLIKKSFIMTPQTCSLLSIYCLRLLLLKPPVLYEPSFLLCNILNYMMSE